MIYTDKKQINKVLNHYLFEPKAFEFYIRLYNLYKDSDKLEELNFIENMLNNNWQYSLD